MSEAAAATTTTIRDATWQGRGADPCADVVRGVAKPLREVTDLALWEDMGGPKADEIKAEWRRRHPQPPIGGKGWAAAAHSIAWKGHRELLPDGHVWGYRGFWGSDDGLREAAARLRRQPSRPEAEASYRDLVGGIAAGCEAAKAEWRRRNPHPRQEGYSTAWQAQAQEVAWGLPAGEVLQHVRW